MKGGFRRKFLGKSHEKFWGLGNGTVENFGAWTHRKFWRQHRRNFGGLIGAINFGAWPHRKFWGWSIENFGSFGAINFWFLSPSLLFVNIYIYKV